MSYRVELLPKHENRVIPIMLPGSRTKAIIRACSEVRLFIGLDYLIDIVDERGEIFRSYDCATGDLIFSEEED